MNYAGTIYKRLTLEASGDFGIGTTDPTQKLDVNGSVNIGGSLAVGTNFSVGASFISVGSSNIVTNLNADLLDGKHGSSYLQIGGTGYFNTALNGLQAIGNTGVGLGGALDRDTKLSIGDTAALFIDYSSGFVGIGSSDPSTALYVNGTVSANKFVGLDHQDEYYLKVNNATTDYSSLSLHNTGSIKWNAQFESSVWKTINGGSYAYKIEGQDDGLLFAASNTNVGNTEITSWNPNLFLAGGGNVGIGTSSPSYLSKLDVYGNINLGSGGTGSISINGDSFISLDNSNIWRFGDIVAQPRSVALVTDGIDRLFINTSGNVGIGTTSPVGKLTVHSNNTYQDYASGGILLESNSGYRLTLAINTNLSGQYASIQSTYNGMSSVSKNLLLNPMGGNVGIGTTNPSTALAFGGDINRIIQMERGTVSSTNGYDLSLIAGGATSGGYSKAGGDLYLSSGISTGSALSNIYFKTAGSIIGADGTQDIKPDTKMIITGSGSVGIGTSSPGTRLVINEDVMTSTNADATLSIGKAAGGATLQLGASSTQKGYLRWNANNTFEIGTGAASYPIYVTNRFGVGTSSPKSTLSVGGTVAEPQIEFGLKDNPGGSLYSQSISQFIVAGGIGITTNSYWYHKSTAYGVINSYNGYINFYTDSGRTVGTTTNALTERMRIAANGSVGIGTDAPGYKLHVVGSGTSGVAFITNTTTGTGRTQPTLIVQTYNTGLGTTGAELIRFLNSSGTKIGRVRLATSTTVNFASSSTADFAEFVFSDENVEVSDLISYHPNGKFGKARSGDIIAGTYSNIGTFTGNDLIGEQPNTLLLTLVGMVDLKVSSQNGSINPGDPISTSHLAGVGAKAIKAGRIVGQALESYSNPDINEVSLIRVMVQPTWYDPDVFLTDTGQVAINYNVSDEVLSSLGYSGTKNEIEAATYSLTDSAGQLVTRVGQYGQLAAAKIETAYLSAKSIVVNNLAARKIASETIITGDITGTEALFDSATIGSLTANSIGASEASFSTVYADQIINPEGNISDVLATKISDLRDEIKSMIASSSAKATPSAIALESETWDTPLATESADLALDNLTLSDSLVIASQLTVNGHSSLNSVNVTGTLTVGQIAFNDNIIETTAETLYIQPSGLGSVHILNDRLVLSSDGSVTINGNLNVTGSLIAQMIKAEEIETKKLSTEKINIISPSEIATLSGELIIAADASPSAEATSSATLASNATVGTVTLAAGQTEITIQNPSLTPNSMVYLTPNGSTGNQVVYIKNKTSNSFAIAIDQPLTQNVDINWWLIN
jgi:hypothetical protein